MSINIIESILEELNLSPFAIQVYLKCVETIEPNVTKIADLLSVERARIYPAIEELTEIGLIAPKEPYGRYITLNSPSRLIAKLRDKEIRSRRLIEDFTKLLPDLNAQLYSNKNKPYIKIYEGKSQFIDLFNQVLDELDKQDGICLFGNTDEWYDMVGFEYHNEWSRQRYKKGFPSRLLVFPSAKLKSVVEQDVNDEQLRTVRWLPEKFQCSGSYYLYANKSIHWNPVLPKAIMIEDSVINSTFRSNFELLWEACGES